MSLCTATAIRVSHLGLIERAARVCVLLNRGTEYIDTIMVHIRSESAGLISIQAVNGSFLALNPQP